MVGQRVDVLTRDGPLPGVVVARVQKQRRGRAEERKALEYDDLFLDVGAKDGDELKSLVRPGDAASLARRAARAGREPRGLACLRQQDRLLCRARGGETAGGAGRRPRRLHRSRRGAGGGRRLRGLANRRLRHRAAGRARGRRDARERRARRRSGGRRQGRPRRRSDAVARAVDPSRRSSSFCTRPRRRRRSRSRSRSRAARRAPTPTPSTSAAAASPRAWSRCRSATCTRRSRWPTSRTSSGRSS